MYLGDHSSESRQKYLNIFESKLHGHACECETSISLYNHKELVKMDEVNKETYYPQKRLAHLPNNFSGLSWYGNYPEHYVGNANYASYEKGEKYSQMQVESLAKFIEAVKKDETLSLLSKEFHSRVKNV